ncbi:MAG TPA: hypothetical protein VKF42_11465, partial [Chitinivibrionales bacterium]|nr:hypothetical protein [Chitinivibrionales bacterium]
MRFLHALFLIVLAQAFAVFGQITWQTTNATYGGSSGPCKLESNTIRMIIHPFSLDVEEEAVISAQGQVQSGGDPTTLVIEGQFALTPGSAVRSMLVWNGNVLLKAKLRERIMEGQLGGPCPGLLQKVGENIYQFKLFPVTIGNSRKIRILYTVPLAGNNLGPQFTIKTAFTYGCAETPSTVPIEFDKATDVPFTFVLTHGAMKITLQAGATYLIPIADLVQYTTDWYGNVTPSGSSSLSLAPDSTSLNRAYQYQVDSTNASGWYAAIFTGFPDTLSAMLKEVQFQLSGYTVEAKVTAGDKSFISDVPYIGCFGVYLKSASPWDHNVYWTVYGSDGTPIFQMTQTISPDTS